MDVAVEFLLVVFVFAKFFVQKRAKKDYIGKDIKPEHKDDYGSKGTVNSGIFYGRAYEPGEKSAYNGENKRTENRPGKNVYAVWASPGVAVINGVEHSGGNYIQYYKTEPVPKVCKVKKIYKIDKLKKRFKNVDKPSSADNRYSKDVNGHKECNGINKAESKPKGIVSAAAFENFPKGIGKNPESGSAGYNRGGNTDYKKAAAL